LKGGIGLLTQKAVLEKLLSQEGAVKRIEALWGRSIFNALFVELILVVSQHASQSPH
jgi:hypothetical protein